MAATLNIGSPYKLSNFYLISSYIALILRATYGRATYERPILLTAYIMHFVLSYIILTLRQNRDPPCEGAVAWVGHIARSPTEVILLYLWARHSTRSDSASLNSGV